MSSVNKFDSVSSSLKRNEKDTMKETGDDGVTSAERMRADVGATRQSAGGSYIR